MTKLADSLRRFNDWMFGWGSPAATSVFRILLGSLAFINFAMIAVDFDVWFSEKGLYPAAFASRWSLNSDGHGNIYEIWRLNLLHDVTSYPVTLGFYILVMLACLTTALGLWTRVSQVVMAVGIITLHHRTPDILHSGDTLLRNMAILLMFANSGAYYSLDRLRLKKLGKADPAPLVSMWPQRLMQLQLATLYMTTVLHKAMGVAWKNGTATWYSMGLREFERFYMPPFTKTPGAIAFTTYFTLVVELAMATLVFAKPMRKWVMLVAVGLHLGIEYSMNIPLFAFAILICFVNHFEGEEIQAWVKRVWEKLGPKRQLEAAHAESGS
jgi:hypothetical protein